MTLRKSATIFIILILSCCGILSAQSIDADVKTYLAQIDNGQSDNVKKALPELMAKYPNNPAVMYLQGKTTPNGIEAAKLYQGIVDNFPKSEWADDALFALYQYYYALGLYKTADVKLQQLKHEYPSSPLASGSQAKDVPYREDEQVKLPSKEVPPDSVRPVPDVPVQPVAGAPVQPVKEPYTLQVGAYSTMKNAEKQKSFFENLGINVEVTNKVRGGRSLYLVWAGSFTTAEEAKTFGLDIKKKYNIDSIVVEKY
ncbi:MAG TPA: SPOR domain-containing protein [Bacteroidota bacterium]|jgi:hypothetical protein|nr:SPOR domain-containing protein [Bacteroidota bacterium]